jgi:hypothetical protein
MLIYGVRSLGLLQLTELRWKFIVLPSVGSGCGVRHHDTIHALMRVVGGKKGRSSDTSNEEGTSTSASDEAALDDEEEEPSLDDADSTSHSDSEGEYANSRKQPKKAKKKKRGRESDSGEEHSSSSTSKTKDPVQKTPKKEKASKKAKKEDGHGTGASSSDSPKPKRSFLGRLETGRSCMNCRHSHVSCNGEIPCDRCIRRGKKDTCERVPPPKFGSAYNHPPRVVSLR